jgi:uncharacterized CHY-type Zn-finger protein
MDDCEYGDCPVCGLSAKYFTCWNCGGEGGWHPYENSPIEYMPDEFDVCDICSGAGGYWICSNCSEDEGDRPDKSTDQTLSDR